MEISNEHNLNKKLYLHDKPYGIRVSLSADDSFARVIGTDWERFHWYHTESERDRALAEMRRHHEYSRRGDFPTVILEKVERGGEHAA